jgi:molecular chaperone GrpE
MIKKKRADEEEAGQERHIEISDNKNNNFQQEDTGIINQINDVTGNNENNLNESVISEETSSAKVDEKENELQEKLAEMQDKYIRLSAEFDNYRKRTLREKMDLSKHASEDLLLRLLPVMDDFDRALGHIESSADFTSLKDGIDLIHMKFNDFLIQNGVKEIEALNSPFNVDVHDAVAKVAVEEEDKKGKIVDVLQKGYYLQDKVLRHAKVVVGE